MSGRESPPMKLRSVLALLSAGVLAGCQTPDVAEYQVSRDSLFLLQQIEPASVSVGALAGPESIGSSASTELVAACSLSANEGPDVPLDPAAYVRGALIEELTAAGLYSDAGSDARLTGEITELSLSRGVPFKGVWTIGLNLASSNGSEMRVREEYLFDIGAFAGATVCRRAVERFEPAVRSLLEKAISSPEFPTLLQER